MRLEKADFILFFCGGKFLLVFKSQFEVVAAVFELAARICSLIRVKGASAVSVAAFPSPLELCKT